MSDTHPYWRPHDLIQAYNLNVTMTVMCNPHTHSNVLKSAFGAKLSVETCHKLPLFGGGEKRGTCGRNFTKFRKWRIAFGA